MKYTAILDFGSKKVHGMLITLGRNGDMQVLNQQSHDYTGLRINVEPDFSSIQQATLTVLEAIQKEAKCDMEQVIIGIPGLYAGIECCKVENHFEKARLIRDEDVQHLIEKSLPNVRDFDRIILHSIPAYYILDGEKIDQVPEDRNVQFLEMVVAHLIMKKEFQEMIAKIFLGTGYQVTHFVDALLAEALYILPETQLENDSVLVDIGAYNTDVRIMRKRTPIFHASLAIGGEHLTNDLAFVTGMTREAAEKIKKYYVFGMDYDEGAENCRMEGGGSEEISCKLIQDVIEARVTELVTMIATTIGSAPIDLKPTTAVVLSGSGLAPIRGSVEFFQKLVSFPVSAPLPKGMPPNSYGLTSAYGVSHYTQDEQEEPEERDRNEMSFFKKFLHFFTE